MKNEERFGNSDEDISQDIVFENEIIDRVQQEFWKLREISEDIEGEEEDHVELNRLEGHNDTFLEYPEGEVFFDLTKYDYLHNHYNFLKRYLDQYSNIILKFDNRFYKEVFGLLYKVNIYLATIDKDRLNQFKRDTLEIHMRDGLKREDKINLFKNMDRDFPELLEEGFIKKIEKLLEEKRFWEFDKLLIDTGVIDDDL